jgi:hypothetical protein
MAPTLPLALVISMAFTTAAYARVSSEPAGYKSIPIVKKHSTDRAKLRAAQRHKLQKPHEAVRDSDSILFRVAPYTLTWA